MNCPQCERLILRSLDDRLSKTDSQSLTEHLEICPSCRQSAEDYQWIRETLSVRTFPEVKPYFWQRLQTGLQDRPGRLAWSIWKQWSLRAIPLALLFVGLLAGGLWIAAPDNGLEMSQSEALLLRNLNPLQDSQTILEMEKVEDKSLSLIFTAMENPNGLRKYFP